MAAQVVIKMSAAHFDTLREAVKLAQAKAKEQWQLLQVTGANVNGNTNRDKEYRAWVDCEAAYNDVLENVLT